MLKKKRFLSKFKSQPSYDLYIRLWYTLDTYLMTRIDSYIFFKYYNWEVPSINLNDMDILKTIMEYDYKVFKVLLFLYWDLEHYLQDKNNVYIRKSLVVDTVDLVFLKIKIKNQAISSFEFWRQNSLKEPKNFWEILEGKRMLDVLLEYNIYSKIGSLDTHYLNDSNMKHYKLYEKFNDIINLKDIMLLRENISKKEKINPSYYQGYIDMWYKQWSLKRNLVLTLKYRRKLKMLSKEWDKLFRKLNLKKLK